jgi:hypothetical protein
MSIYFYYVNVLRNISCLLLLVRSLFGDLGLALALEAKQGVILNTPYRLP